MSAPISLNAPRLEMEFSELERATVCAIYATQEARQKKMSNGSTLVCAHASRDASRLASRYCRVEILRGQRLPNSRNNTGTTRLKKVDGT